MLQMVAAGPGRGKNGGIRNGRTVVPENGACQGGRKGHCHDGRGGGLADEHHNGDEETEGAPGSADGEGKSCCHQEYDGRQQFHGQIAGFHQHTDVFSGAQVILTQGANGPGHGQDDVGRDHGIDPCTDAVHELTEGHELPGDELEKGYYQSPEAAQYQSCGRIAVADGCLERKPLGPETAIVEHGQDHQADRMM